MLATGITRGRATVYSRTSTGGTRTYMRTIDGRCSFAVRGTLSLRSRHGTRRDGFLCSSVVRSAFGRFLCGVRLVLVRVAFVRGGRLRGGSRTHNGLLTDGTRACLRTSDGRATGGHRSDLDESSHPKMGGGVAAAFHAARCGQRALPRTNERRSRGDRPTSDF